MISFKIPLILTSVHILHGNSALRNDVNRLKRQQDDRWVWVDEANNSSSSMEQTDNKPNPCNQNEHQMPDFNRHGVRISAQKCYEYIWEIKRRRDQETRRRACEDYKDMADKDNSERIHKVGVIGGRSALSAEFPHMAAIGWQTVSGSYIFKCGGSLISDKFVLTAAHCVNAGRDDTLADRRPKIVRVGIININDVSSNSPNYYFDGQIMNIKSHPGYKSPKKYFDIALMEIDRPIQFSDNVQPACLWNDDNPGSLGSKAFIAGWGVMEAGGLATSPTLQVAEVDIIDTQSCDNLLRPKCGRHWCGLQGQICAGKLIGGVDSCQGDSGGPLQTEIALPEWVGCKMYYVIGVTSFGYKCAAQNSPGVYTSVASYIDWIESVVWPFN